MRIEWLRWSVVGGRRSEVGGRRSADGGRRTEVGDVAAQVGEKSGSGLQQGESFDSLKCTLFGSRLSLLNRSMIWVLQIAHYAFIFNILGSLF